MRHRVAVVVPDVDRRADRSVGHRHHDWKAQSRGVVNGFGHVKQSLAGGRRVGARSGGGGADCDRHRGELRLDVDELAGLELALLDQLGKCFHDVGLRRDRIGTDHLRSAQGYGLRNRLGPLNLAQHRSTPPSLRFGIVEGAADGRDVAVCDCSGEPLADRSDHRIL